MVSVLDVLGPPFAEDIQQGGLAGIQAHGDPLPGATLDSIRRTGHTLMPGGRFEDIDEAAPGGDIGEKGAIFEAVHGSAPDIAGKGIANPTALLLAAGLMLDHVGHVGLAQRLRTAVDGVLNGEKARTRGFGGTASTQDFARAVIRRVNA